MSYRFVKVTSFYRDFLRQYYLANPQMNMQSYDYQYKNLGRIAIKGKIIDSSESIFTPCSYSINCSNVIEQTPKVKDMKKNLISEIASFRGRYCEQAIKDEKVFVVGKLEEITYKQRESHYRILLTDQKLDKMIVLMQ